MPRALGISAPKFQLKFFGVLMVRKLLVLALVLLGAQVLFGSAPASAERLVYQITVTNPGTKSQGWYGTLYDQDGNVMQVETGKRIKTIAGEFESVPFVQLWIPHGMIHVDTLRWLKEGGSDVIHDDQPWRYKLYVVGEGTRSQGFRGELLRGQDFVTPETSGEHVKTPMGPFDWVENPHGWGSHGWIHAAWTGWIPRR
jgi:hypothetical protein